MLGAGKERGLARPAGGTARPAGGGAVRAGGRSRGRGEAVPGIGGRAGFP